MTSWHSPVANSPRTTATASLKHTCAQMKEAQAMVLLQCQPSKAVRVSTNGDLKMWALFRLSLFRQHKNRYSAPLIRMSPRASSFSSQDSPRQYKRTEHSSTHGAQPHRVRHAVRFQTRRGSLTCVHAIEREHASHMLSLPLRSALLAQRAKSNQCGRPHLQRESKWGQQVGCTARYRAPG